MECRKHCLTLYFGWLSVQGCILERGSSSAVLAAIFEQRVCFGANEPHSNMLCARQSCNARHNPVSFSLFLVLIYDYLFLNTAAYYRNQTCCSQTSFTSKQDAHCILSRATKCRPSNLIYAMVSLLQEQNAPCIIALGSILCALFYFFLPPHLKPEVSLLIAHAICFLCSRYSRCAGSCPCLQGGM